MKESLLRGFFAVILMTLFFWLYACTPTAHRIKDEMQGAATLPAQAPPSLSKPSVDLPISEPSASIPVPSTINSPTHRLTFSPVVVEAFDIMLREGFPLRVNVWLSGYLENTCQGLRDIIEYREGQVFRLEFYVAQGTPSCRQNQAFDIMVPLDVNDLSAGIYRVEVANQTAEFEILMDNREAVGFKQNAQ